MLALLADFWRWLGHTLATCLLMAFLLFGIMLQSFPAYGQSVFSDGFEPKTQACTPLPAGFTVREFAWDHVFFGGIWPNDAPHLSPIGSWTLRRGNPVRGQPIAGILITTPIVMDGGTHKIDWVNAQVISAAGYRTPQAAFSVTVTISKCRADVAAVCQGSAASGALFYGVNASNPSCRFAPATPLWVTWHFADADPLSPFFMNPLVNTCNPLNPSLGVQCDANFGAR